jgi:hypothetical protein
MIASRLPPLHSSGGRARVRQKATEGLSYGQDPNDHTYHKPKTRRKVTNAAAAASDQADIGGRAGVEPGAPKRKQMPSSECAKTHAGVPIIFLHIPMRQRGPPGSFKITCQGDAPDNNPQLCLDMMLRVCVRCLFIMQAHKNKVRELDPDTYLDRHVCTARAWCAPLESLVLRFCVDSPPLRSCRPKFSPRKNH